MLNVSIIIPAWNEAERIRDCLLNATRQTIMPHEVLVVDNRSTDNTCAVVEQFIAEHPEAPVKLLHQNDEQGLIPTRNFGLNAATGDVLGRFDADCMIRPDWVEVVSGIFTEDPAAMGATGPVMYYDMPSRHFGLKGDNSLRKRIYRADGGQPPSSQQQPSALPADKPHLQGRWWPAVAVWLEYGGPRFSLA